METSLSTLMAPQPRASHTSNDAHQTLLQDIQTEKMYTTGSTSTYRGSHHFYSTCASLYPDEVTDASPTVFTFGARKNVCTGGVRLASDPSQLTKTTDNTRTTQFRTDGPSTPPTGYAQVKP